MPQNSTPPPERGISKREKIDNTQPNTTPHLSGDRFHDLFEQVLQGQQQLSRMQQQISQSMDKQLHSLTEQLKQTNLRVTENHAIVTEKNSTVTENKAIVLDSLDQQIPSIMQRASSDHLGTQSAAEHEEGGYQRQKLVKSLLEHMVRALNDGNLDYHVRIGQGEPFKGFMLQWIQEETLLSDICDEQAAEKWFATDNKSSQPSLIRLVGMEWRKFKTHLKGLVLDWFKDKGLQPGEENQKTWMHKDNYCAHHSLAQHVLAKVKDNKSRLVARFGIRANPAEVAYVPFWKPREDTVANATFTRVICSGAWASILSAHTRAFFQRHEDSYPEDSRRQSTKSYPSKGLLSQRALSFEFYYPQPDTLPDGVSLLTSCFEISNV